jgi:flagellar motor switch protein FliN/FliY
MALLEPSEMDALAHAATTGGVHKEPARALPFTLGRGDQESTRALAALDTYVPDLNRRLRERLRQQTRQQLDIEDAVPRPRTVEELLTQAPRTVCVEIGGGSGLPLGLLVCTEQSARAFAMASMGIKPDVSDPLPITPGELRLFSRLMNVLVDDLKEILPKNAPAQPLRFLRVLTDGRLVSARGPVVAIPFNIHGDIEAALELGLPSSWLVRPKLTLPASSKRPRRRIGDDKSSVVLSVAAELGRTKMTLRRLLALEPGDIVHLLSSPNQPLPVLVQGASRLAGRPEVKDGRVVIVVDAPAGAGRRVAEARPDASHSVELSELTT